MSPLLHSLICYRARGDIRTRGDGTSQTRNQMLEKGRSNKPQQLCSLANGVTEGSGKGKNKTKKKPLSIWICGAERIIQEIMTRRTRTTRAKFSSRQRTNDPSRGVGVGWGGCVFLNWLATVTSKNLQFCLHSGVGTPTFYLKWKQVRVRRISRRRARDSMLSIKSCQQIKGSMTLRPISPSTGSDRSAPDRRSISNGVPYS